MILFPKCHLSLPPSFSGKGSSAAAAAAAASLSQLQKVRASTALISALDGLEDEEGSNAGATTGAVLDKCGGDDGHSMQRTPVDTTTMLMAVRQVAVKTGNTLYFPRAARNQAIEVVRRHNSAVKDKDVTL